VDAHGCGKRFVVRNDEKLTAFLELKTVIRPKGTNLNLGPIMRVRREPIRKLGGI
jgi:hypothetical protein